MANNSSFLVNANSFFKPNQSYSNSSNSSSPGDSNTSILFNSTQSHSNSNGMESRVKLGIDIAIFVVAVLGNVLVLVVIYTTKEHRKTPFEILIANLCVADILTVLLHFIFFNFNIPTSNWFCKLEGGFFPSIQMVSMLTMTTIAIFRCRSIVHLFKTKPSTKLTCCIVLGLWLLANFCLLPVYIVIKEYNGKCTEIWSSQLLNKVYTVSLAVVQYLIPFTIMAVCYTRIVVYLKRQKVHQSGFNIDKINQHKTTRRRDMEVIKISLVIVLLYNVSTLPSHIAWIGWIVFESYDMSNFIFKFSGQLLLLHCCCNPFVYGTISREFRSRFVRVFRSIFCCMCKIRRTQIGVLKTKLGQRNNAPEDLEMTEIKGYVKRDEPAAILTNR